MVQKEELNNYLKKLFVLLFWIMLASKLHDYENLVCGKRRMLHLKSRTVIVMRTILTIIRRIKILTTKLIVVMTMMMTMMTVTMTMMMTGIRTVKTQRILAQRRSAVKVLCFYK